MRINKISCYCKGYIRLFILGRLNYNIRLLILFISILPCKFWRERTILHKFAKALAHIHIKDEKERENKREKEDERAYKWS